MAGVNENKGKPRLRPRHYEIVVVAILCLIFGILGVEIFGISYLMPFIGPSLHLSNTQIGLLSSGYWVTFAFSSYVSGVLTDKLGKQRAILQSMLLLFAVTSVLSGFASSFWSLMAARVLMGLVEAPVFLISQSIIVLESPAERSGVNMGIAQNLGNNILGAFVAPLLLVHLATHYNWRVGFFIVALPGLVCAALVGRFVREPPRHEVLLNECDGGRPAGAGGLTEVVRYRNVWLCVMSTCFFVAYITITYGFLPLFLIQDRHFQPEEMSILMSVFGISGMLLGVALPALSDRIGRKPVMIVTSVLGAFCPLAAMWYSGSLAILAMIMFIGWGLAGSTTLIFATIPSESVPARSISTVMGLILAVSTLVGGVAGPAVAGWSADHWGLFATMWLAVGCCVFMTGLSLALRESAPRRSRSAVTEIVRTS